MIRSIRSIHGAPEVRVIKEGSFRVDPFEARVISAARPGVPATYIQQ